MKPVKCFDDSSIRVPYLHPNVPAMVGRIDQRPAAVERQRGSDDTPVWYSQPHWHPEVEIVCVRDGKMRYHANAEEVRLGSGDCLVLNSRRIHFAEPVDASGCSYDILLFAPEGLLANDALVSLYVEPLVELDSFDCLRLPADEEDAARVREAFDRLHALVREQPYAFELECSVEVACLWTMVVVRCKAGIPFANRVPQEELASVKSMVSYVKENHAGKVTLSEIAQAGQTSKTKCSQLFREYLDASPIDFLITYRLERSRALLDRTDKPIADIAGECGFSSQGYYSKAFKQKYGMAPSEYRKSQARLPS